MIYPKVELSVPKSGEQMRRFFWLCMLGLAGFSNAQAQTGLAQRTGLFRPADRLFAAAFPANPTVKEDSLPSTTGAPYKRMTYSYQSSSNILMVGVLYAARGTAISDAEQATLLHNSVESMISGMPAFVIDKNAGIASALLDGHKGERIRGINNGAGVDAAFYVTPRYVFMIQGFYDPSDPAAKAATAAFVNSLRITDK
jgi:hypothetical protein